MQLYFIHSGRTVPTFLINGHLDSECTPNECTPTVRQKRKFPFRNTIDENGSKYKYKKENRRRKSNCSSSNAGSASSGRSTLRSNAPTPSSAVLHADTTTRVTVDAANDLVQYGSCEKASVLQTLSKNTAPIAKLHPELPGLYLVEVRVKHKSSNNDTDNGRFCAWG